jgi:spore germination protein YaaH
MALVTSFQGARFHPETIRGMAFDSVFLARTAGAIAAMVGRGGYRGLVMDFEGMTPSDLPSLRHVVSAVADSARAHGVGPVGVAIPATDTAAYPARPLLESTDFVVVMLYGQHWRTSPPGPIVSPDWARRWLGVRIGEIGPGKIVAAYPTYGYRWPTDSAAALLSYADANRAAAEANVALGRDGTSGMLHAQTAGWTMWVADAHQLDRLIRDARVSGVTKFALWRLGLEDPAVWMRVAPPRYTTIKSR